MRAFAFLALLAVGCFSEATIPGDEQLGTFDFRAEPLASNCQLRDVPDAGFIFSGLFSRQSATGEAWLTLGGMSRSATFDGQVAVSRHSAGREFAECEGQDTQLDETLAVALVSKSQDREVERLLGTARCPDHPLDGGLPASDGGVLPPLSTDRGFDAVRACGELVEVLVPGPNAGDKCPPCEMRFRVVGDRR